ncbi:MAG: hydrolase superfamily-like protein [Marmoricola sp.]|nr:hydrolase superfamily-like protein [Marmoricola sp.]
MRTSGLILDYVGVLAQVQTDADVRGLATLADLPVDDFVHRYWAHRIAYDLGLTDAAYWHRVLGRPPTSDLLSSLVAADLAGLLRLDQHLVHRARTLAERGAGVAVLSNAPTFLARAVERLDELAFVDTFVFSCDIGVAKPDPEAFQHALRALGLQGEDCTFIDDRAENLAAARALGIRVG